MARSTEGGHDAPIKVNELLAEIDGMLESYQEPYTRSSKQTNVLDVRSFEQQRMSRQASSVSMASTRSGQRRPLPPTPSGRCGPQYPSSPGLPTVSSSTAPPPYTRDASTFGEGSSRRGSEAAIGTQSDAQEASTELCRFPSGSTTTQESLPQYTLKRSGTRTLRLSDAQLVSAATVLRGTSVDMAQFSQIAQLLVCTLQRKPLIKGSVVYPLSFTGRMLVQAIRKIIMQYVHTSVQFSQELPEDHAQYMAMSIGRSFKSQLFLHEADWEDHPFSAGVDEVYMFFSDGASSDKLDMPAVQASNVDGALFERQSPNRVGLGAQAALACVGSSLQDWPTGVLAPLTRCYSPTCALSSNLRETCYVPSCPRMNRAWRSTDLNVADAKDETQIDATATKAWVETVPQELVATLSTREVKRQNAIFEMIQKEEAFLRDLQLLGHYVHKLRDLAKTSDVVTAQIAPLYGAELDRFVDTVFGNHSELLSYISVFCDRLQERQREQSPLVETVGDLVVEAALEWGSAYTTYVQHYPVALHTLKHTVATSARMAKFVDDCRRDPASNRHPLENFLFRPPARLQRYHLHLESIVKYTEPDNSDHEQLMLAMEVIDEQCKVAQAGVEAAEQRLLVDEFATRLEAKRPDCEVDLDLSDPKRKVLHHGIVFRRPDAFDFEWKEMEAILLDNYLVLAKRKSPSSNLSTEQSGEKVGVHLVYNIKPVPVGLVEASGFQEPSISRGHLNRRLMPGDMTDMYPFTLHLPAREPLLLYVATAQQRAEWHQHFLSVVAATQAHEALHSPFQRERLCEKLFGNTYEGPLPRITCAATFYLPDQTRMLAVGTSDGVWIALHGQSRSFHKVLHLRGVTHCAVLQEQGQFLLLAERSLIAYDLEALVPSRGPPTKVMPQKLSGNRDVLFFATGFINDKQLLVYGKKRTAETSVRILELVGATNNQTDISKGLWRRRPSETFSHFREHSKFYVGYEASGAQFLRQALVVYTHRGFQIYSLETGTLDLFPSSNLRDDVKVAALVKQLDTARPLGVFHLSNSLVLLCYDRFACYVDVMGHFIGTEPAFYWEGLPTRFASAAQYVLAFSENFIEIWDPIAAKLCHTLRGDDLQLLTRQDNAYEPAATLLIAEGHQQITALHVKIT
ncbi:Rho guanine nucleotide exchange factor [Malassezia psittaci]|uniref:Rho guanine nucleotide exchange factor n=1 Tax=Malassezia psittaci TaxID=1821823 RepID=A0AAF0JEY0_9BASI|nr:Rho guanine nucleotide exchange factor [Malassezia psittaci]